MRQQNIYQLRYLSVLQYVNLDFLLLSNGIEKFYSIFLEDLDNHLISIYNKYQNLRRCNYFWRVTSLRIKCWIIPVYSFIPSVAWTRQSSIILAVYDKNDKYVWQICENTSAISAIPEWWNSRAFPNKFLKMSTTFSVANVWSRHAMGKRLQPPKHDKRTNKNESFKVIWFMSENLSATNRLWLYLAASMYNCTTKSGAIVWGLLLLLLDVIGTNQPNDA